MRYTEKATFAAANDRIRELEAEVDSHIEGAKVEQKYFDDTLARNMTAAGKQYATLREKRENLQAAIDAALAARGKREEGGATFSWMTLVFEMETILKEARG